MSLAGAAAPLFDAPAAAPAKAKKKNAHLWARHPEDWYVEPAWCDTGLFRAVRFEGPIVDPCCGYGRILNAAHAAGYQTFGMDIVDRGAARRHSFVLGDFRQTDTPFRNIVCNPPFALADAFLAWALRSAQKKAALLLPSSWANADKRAALLQTLPLRHVLALSPRPSMPPGTVLEAGQPAGNGPHRFRVVRVRTRPCRRAGIRLDTAQGQRHAAGGGGRRAHGRRAPARHSRL